MDIKENISSEDLCESVVEIVMETRDIIERIIVNGMSPGRKGQGNYVTVVDETIETFLIKKLGKLLPNTGFISEESGSIGDSDTNWIIDPIDGTNNLLNGFEYTISIALQSKDKTELAVIYMPAENTLYLGLSGKGSFKRNADGTRSRLFLKKFPCDEGIIFFGLPYDRSKVNKIFSIANKLYSISSDMKRIGPASLDICRVAEGVAKLYFELDLRIWDVAAGELILREAGGEVYILDDLFIFGSKATINEAINALSLEM
ncbi:MAG: hypothetical protein FWE83_11310 [Oscillospiraceae bacterium]|nr:hypothetical protein [Oscillospiraceae bacterium]